MKGGGEGQMTGRSLQRRLGTGLTLGVTLLWLMAVGLSALVVHHELNEVFDSALEETAQRLLPLAVVEITNREQMTPQRIVALAAHEEYLTYLVRDARGNILLRSHDAEPAVFGDRPRRGFASTETHRLYGVSAVRDSIWIQVAEPLAHRREAALEASAALLLPLLLLIPLSLAGVWWLVRSSLGSVRSLRADLAARGAGDLSPVPDAELPTELRPITEAVNQLLARLRRALEAERSFTANSAHELRTPLATALAQLQGLRRTLPTHHQEQAQRIEESLRGLARLAESLMQLAKAEGGGLLSEQASDLAPVLALVVDELRHRAPQPLRLTLPAGPLPSTLDPDAFAILARNLIDNAIKHGAADQPVEISLSEDGLLRVVNACPVVPGETLARLRSRFVRANSAAPGSGLGLAIADAIAAGTGAELRLLSPASGREDGFEAQFDLGASLAR